MKPDLSIERPRDLMLFFRISWLRNHTGNLAEFIVSEFILNCLVCDIVSSDTTDVFLEEFNGSCNNFHVSRYSRIMLSLLFFLESRSLPKPILKCFPNHNDLKPHRTLIVNWHSTHSLVFHIISVLFDFYTIT